MLTDQEIIELHAQGHSVYRMSIDHNVPSTSLHRRCAKLGLNTSSKCKTRDSKIKDKTQEILSMFEQGATRGEIARALGCDHSTVSRILKKHDRSGRINNKTHSFDESFYATIDTEDKAYSLGFFTADGCNRSNNASISITDRDVVEKIAIAMRYTGNIRVIEPTETSKTRLRQYQLNICSTKICSDLCRLGCPPRKTFVTRFPEQDQVPKSLLRHYLRGLFDGDGTIYHTSNGWHIGFAGTDELLAPAMSYIRDQTDITVGGVYDHGNIKVLKIPGIANCVRVLDWLYEDSTIHMDRKFDLYETMKEEYYIRCR